MNRWKYMINDEVKEELKEKKNLIVILLLSIVIFMLTGFSVVATIFFTILSILIFKTLVWILWQFLKPTNTDKTNILKRKNLADKIAYLTVIAGILIIALNIIFFITDSKDSHYLSVKKSISKDSNGEIIRTTETKMSYDIHYNLSTKDNEK